MRYRRSIHYSFVVTFDPPPPRRRHLCNLLFPNEYKHEKSYHVCARCVPATSGVNSGVNVTYNSADEPEIVV